MAKKLASALSEINRRLDADTILSAEEKEIIRAKAREEVLKRRKETAEKAYLEAAMRDEERSFNPEEQYENVIIDLAPYAAFIAIDGMQYFHGLSYEVTYGVARVMADVCARTWEHQREIKGERRRGSDVMWEGIRQKQGGLRISPSDVGAAPESLNTRRDLTNVSI